ncbi:hypothetical protein HK102_013290 [Quaeritorhiza haematococci]|nr:hypothetical protein HK102_013290 [Quaeritorhiza haematococci]
MDIFEGNDTWNELDDDPLVDLFEPGTEEEVRAKYYNIILWTPFLAIPVGIILARLLKYVWRIYRAKKAGKHQDLTLLRDPLAELGLYSNADYAKMKQIKRIKKEQEKFKKWREIEKQRLLAQQQDAKKERQPQQVDGEKKEWTAVEAGEDPLKPNDSQSIRSAETNKVKQRAHEYLGNLRRRTRQTWSETLSPEAIRRFFSATKYGRMWMIFQVLCTVVAILNYIILTYRDENHDKKAMKWLDVGLATVFLFDYMISLYTAEDRLRFYFHPSSLIDLLSIIPPFVYVFIKKTDKFVWFLGLLRILRATRVLRTYRLISFQESEERRELTILALSFVNFLFLSASIINALETLEGNHRDPPSLTTWHDSLYYIMVTFSTIGFGDLTPSTVPSRVLVMCLIVIVIVFVPLQTGKLAELYNSTNAYQRARYNPSDHNAHVIMSGAISYAAIIDFCREYFVNDPTGHVVILATDPPTLDLRRLLRHPYYRNRVHYLCGSPLVIPDLRRCAADHATGVFLLNTTGETSATASSTAIGDEEQLRVTRGADADILMQALVVKHAFPGLPVFTEVQDIRSQDLSSHCGCDRTLCMDEIKMALIARNCIVPGILTLIQNLVHSYQQKELGSSLSQNAGFSSGVPGMPGHGQDESHWVNEYQDGAAHQLYAFNFPTGFVGCRFSEALLAVYNVFGVTIIGVVTNHRGGGSLTNKSGKIRLNPGKNYIVRSDDIAICMAHGGDEMLMRVSVHFQDPSTALADMPSSNLAVLKNKNINNITLTVSDADVLGSGDETMDPNIKQKEAASFEELTSPGGINHVGSKDSNNVGDGEPGLLAAGPKASSQVALNITTTRSPHKNHIILCGNVTARGIRHFVRTIRTGEMNPGVKSPGSGYPPYVTNGASTTTYDPNILRSASSTLPTTHSTSFAATPLLPNDRETPIVCLLDTFPATLDGIWEDIVSYPAVHLVKGTPLKKTNLMHAGIATCKCIVIFASNQSSGGGSGGGVGSAALGGVGGVPKQAAAGGFSIPDANAIFTVQMIKEEWPRTNFIVELVNGSNTRYFSMREQCDWNNIRMQSVLNNYSLSISDRLVLYKRMRNASENGLALPGVTFLKRLIRFATGAQKNGSNGGSSKSFQVYGVGAGVPIVVTNANNLPGGSNSTANSGSAAETRGIGNIGGNGFGMKGDGRYARLDDIESDMHESAIISGYGNARTTTRSRNAQYSPISMDTDPDSSAVPLTTMYLQRLEQEAELNESGLSPFPVYHFDRHFAAGMVTTSSFIHSLLCQIYFRPFLVDIVKLLTNSVVQFPVPPEFHGCKYMDLLMWLLEKGYIPLGLYRNALLRPKSDGVQSCTSTASAAAAGDREDVIKMDFSREEPKADIPTTNVHETSHLDEIAHLPYVYTNCKAFDDVYQQDMIFALIMR